MEGAIGMRARLEGNRDEAGLGFCLLLFGMRVVRSGFDRLLESRWECDLGLSLWPMVGSLRIDKFTASGENCL